MGTEPTLGERILYEVYRVAPFISGGARADLRALCARADAAERLAVAVEWCDEDGWSFTSERYNEYHEAFAEWLEITGKVQP